MVETGDAQRAAGTRGDTLTLFVDVALPDRELCGNGRANGFKRSRLVKAQRDAAQLAAYKALADHPDTLRRPLFPAGVRVEVRALVRRAPFWSARRLDDDNLWRGLKPSLDALAGAGAIFNDSQLTLGRVTWALARPGEHGVTLWLTAVPGADLG